MDGGLREQNKARTRQGLMRIALELFEARGFDEVTVEEIAEAAMVSPRTFYRYFGTKEGVLYDDHEGQLELLHEIITSHPAADPPLTAVQAAVVELARQSTQDLDLGLRRLRLSEATTSLGVYARTTLVPLWEDALARAVAERLGVDVAADVRPRLLAAIGLAVMSSVSQTLSRDGGGDLEAVVVARFADLRDLVLAQDPPAGRLAPIASRAGTA